MNARVGEAQLMRALEDLLLQVPLVRDVRRVRAAHKGGRGLDGALVLRLVRGATQRWVVETKRLALEPYFAGMLALAMPEAIVECEADYGVVVAPFVSERSAEILARAGIGYCDLSGNCRLVSGPLYVERTGFANTFARKATLRSLFTPGAERVLRAVLDPDHRGKSWTVRELAAAASPGVSAGQAHKVAKLLKEQAFLRRVDQGLIVHEPEKLLTQWSESYRFSRNQATRFYSLLGTEELRERFVALVRAEVKKGAKGALASFTAAEVLAPHVRQHRFFAYWQGDAGKVTRALQLKEVPSGENVVLYTPYDEGVLYPAHGVAEPVTCPVQTYLDLRASPARGEEAAEAVFNRYLKRAYNR